MKVDVMKELRTMRTRFVNCAIHNGSDREFAEAACESFDEAVSNLQVLIECATAASALLDRTNDYSQEAEELSHALAQVKP